jgi:hypothetical protein
MPVKTFGFLFSVNTRAPKRTLRLFVKTELAATPQWFKTVKRQKYFDRNLGALNYCESLISDITSDMQTVATV